MIFHLNCSNPWSFIMSTLLCCPAGKYKNGNHRKQRGESSSAFIVPCILSLEKKYSRLRAVGLHASERKESQQHQRVLGEKSEIVCFPRLSSA
jgi:hypothetical protein